MRVSEHQGQLYWSQIREPAPQPPMIPTDYESGAPATEEASVSELGATGVRTGVQVPLAWA